MTWAWLCWLVMLQSLTVMMRLALMRPPPPESDGVLFADWKVEGNRLIRRLVQPGDGAILSANSERRKDPDSIRSLDWGKLVMRIPENHLLILTKKHPDLNSPHRSTRYLAWLKFHNSAESDPYRLQYRSRKRG